MSTQETQDIINAFLSELLEGVKSAGAFVKEQLPLVLQEYITWGIVSGFLLFASAIAVSFCVMKWVIPPMRRRRDELRAKDSFGSMDYNAGIAVTTVITIGFFVAMFLVGLLPAIKAMVAPRVYLLEELSKLVK